MFSIFKNWVFDSFLLNDFGYNALQIGILVLLNLWVNLQGNRDIGCTLDCVYFYQMAWVDELLRWNLKSSEFWNILRRKEADLKWRNICMVLFRLQKCKSQQVHVDLIERSFELFVLLSFELSKFLMNSSSI